MAKKIKKSFFQLIKSTRGQMAIFIVLIFQVLFVLFAMVINIGLVVHDKINLQNAVDLAAYYAAQKQAEVLNVIAHQNYQIRQSWKLLSFRYRGFGTLGQDQGPSHPLTNPNRANRNTESLFFNNGNVPTVCIYVKPTWAGAPEGENPCKNRNFSIPPLRIPVNIAPWGGFNASIISAATRLKESFDRACENRGGLNWLYAMRILTSYRIDQNNRKQLIWSLARNLSRRDFIELNGESVLVGTRKTLLKNLTFMNRGVDDYEGGAEEAVQMDFINSLEGVDPMTLLPPIHINPTLMYTDIKQGEGCHADPKNVYVLPERGDNVFSILNDQTEVATFKGYARTHENMIPVNFRMSLGVEKNPWYMAYVGVKARTKPRQIFFPFGPTISLEARAFAKPFGGRIGPWYQSTWPRSNTQSSGDKTDRLAPFRDSGLLQLTTAQSSARLPNYSRFPGDQLGLSSNLSLTAVRDILRSNHNIDYYSNIFAEMGEGGVNDVMALNSRNPADTNANGVRSKEIAAIAPDLFDVTYYSIQPEYNSKYLPMILANRNNLGIDSSLVIRGDLGSRNNTNLSFNVADQIAAARANINPWSFYHITDKKNLLTDWVSRGHVDYGFPTNAFQTCKTYDTVNPTVKTGGSCIVGGRVGYSVKLVARDFLNSSIQSLGGAGLNGAIENPPSKFNW